MDLKIVHEDEDNNSFLYLQKQYDSLNQVWNFNFDRKLSFYKLSTTFVILVQDTWSMGLSGSVHPDNFSIIAVVQKVLKYYLRKKEKKISWHSHSFCLLYHIRLRWNLLPYRFAYHSWTCLRQCHQNWYHLHLHSLFCHLRHHRHQIDYLQSLYRLRLRSLSCHRRRQNRY